MIKPTPIVQMANEITLFQRKIYNYLIKNSMGYLQKDILQREFLSSISEIKSLFNNNNYAFIKKDLSVLRKTTVNISLLNRDRKKVIYDFNLINEMKFTGENKIEFSLPSLVIEEIVGNFNNEKKKNLYFTNLNLSSISNLKSKYSLSLYENLKAYTNGFNMPKVDIDTFRTLVGVEDGKFPLMGNLKKKVIDSSVQEINEKTELNVEYEMFKTGRKITHIKFYSDENKKISDLTNEYIDISQEYITFWDTYIPKHCKDIVLTTIDNDQIIFDSKSKKLSIKSDSSLSDNIIIKNDMVRRVQNNIYDSKDNSQWFNPTDFNHLVKEDTKTLFWENIEDSRALIEK